MQHPTTASRIPGHFIEFHGERLNISQWSARCGVSRQTILNRLDAGYPVEMVLREGRYGDRPGTSAHRGERERETERDIYRLRGDGARLKKYGLSHSQYHALLVKQGNACAICGLQFESAPTSHANLGRRPHVDHDHATGRVRGILCGPCNKGIGFFRDSPSALRRAARYLST